MNPEYNETEGTNVFMEQFVRGGVVADEEIGEAIRPKPKSLMDLMNITNLNQNMPISKPKSLLDYVNCDATVDHSNDGHIQNSPFSIDLVSPPLIPTVEELLEKPTSSDDSMDELPDTSSEHINVDKLHQEVTNVLSRQLTEEFVETSGSISGGKYDAVEEVEISSNTEMFQKSIGLNDIIGESTGVGGLSVPPGSDDIDNNSNQIESESVDNADASLHEGNDPKLTSSDGVSSQKVYDDATIAKLLVEPNYHRLSEISEGELEMPSAATFLSVTMRDTDVLFQDKFKKMKLEAVEPLKIQIEELQSDCAKYLNELERESRAKNRALEEKSLLQNQLIQANISLQESVTMKDELDGIILALQAQNENLKQALNNQPVSNDMDNRQSQASVIHLQELDQVKSELAMYKMKYNASVVEVEKLKLSANNVTVSGTGDSGGGFSLASMLAGKKKQTVDSTPLPSASNPQEAHEMMMKNEHLSRELLQLQQAYAELQSNMGDLQMQNQMNQQKYQGDSEQILQLRERLLQSEKESQQHLSKYNEMCSTHECEQKNWFNQMRDYEFQVKDLGNKLEMQAAELNSRINDSGTQLSIVMNDKNVLERERNELKNRVNMLVGVEQEYNLLKNQYSRVEFDLSIARQENEQLKMRLETAMNQKSSFAGGGLPSGSSNNSQPSNIGNRDYSYNASNANYNYSDSGVIADRTHNYPSPATNPGNQPVNVASSNSSKSLASLLGGNSNIEASMRQSQSGSNSHNLQVGAAPNTNTSKTYPHFGNQAQSNYSFNNGYTDSSASFEPNQNRSQNQLASVSNPSYSQNNMGQNYGLNSSPVSQPISNLGAANERRSLSSFKNAGAASTPFGTDYSTTSDSMMQFEVMEKQLTSLMNEKNTLSVDADKLHQRGCRTLAEKTRLKTSESRISELSKEISALRKKLLSKPA